MDENTKVVLITLIGAVVTIATGYIAARWHTGRMSNHVKPGNHDGGDNTINH